MNESLGKIIGEIFDDLTKMASKTWDNLFNFFKSVSKEQYDAINQYGGLGKVLQDAWSIENQSKGELALKDVIAWLKSHLPKDMRCRGCMIVLDKTLVTPTELSFPHHYYVCFLDTNNEILHEKPQIFFHCNVIDAELQQSFAGKDMIIFG